MASLETRLFKAKIAEQSERYEEMIAIIKELINENPKLNPEERNLFSAAFKNYISGKRSAYRTIAAILKKEEDKASPRIKLVSDYQAKIESEIEAVCKEANSLIDTKLIPAAEKDDAKVFYYKMKADYFRYFAECTSGDKRNSVSVNAEAAYKEASKLAECLKITDPVRLGLALNYSVFNYEILNSPEEACKLAKATFDNAVSQLESLPDEDYKDSAAILQLIRDNLSLWQSEEGGKEEVQNL